MNLSEAVRKLSDKYGPTRYFSVTMSVNRHSNSEPEAGWQVYRESKSHGSGKNFAGKTLDIAVDSALADDDQPEDLDAVQEVLVGESHEPVPAGLIVGPTQF